MECGLLATHALGCARSKFARRSPRASGKWFRAACLATGALAALLSSAVGRSDAATIGRFAFTSQDSRGTSAIYVVNSDGTGRARVGEGSAPTWSPDGSQIAFVHDTLENFDVWVMRADGTERRRLTDDPAFDTDPAWSPDGTSIAFASNRVRSFDIYVMGADGSNETPLTNNPDDEAEPSWSPDGRRIAYTSANTDGSAVFTMSSDGSDQQQLTSTTSDTAPAWSPDGTSIAFVSGRSGTADIYRVPSGGGREVRVTTVGNVDDPSWSPDAQQLAFGVNTAVASSTLLAQASPESSLHTVNADGTSVARINSETSDSDPAWRPASPDAADGSEGPLITPAPADDRSAEADVEGTREDGSAPGGPQTTAGDRRGAAASRAADASDADRTRAQAQPITPTDDEDRDRSTFPASLIEPADVRFDPAALVASALLAALIPLLIFPAILFNNTLEENYDEVRGWFRRQGEAPAPKEGRRPLFRFVALALGASLAAVFLDPELDLDRASLALFIGIIGAFVIATVVDFAPVLYLRRRRSEPGSLRTYAGAFAVVVVCVALSRAVGFEPGYLYGTLAGFAMASTITGPARGWAQTISVAALLSWALVAWALWIPIGRAAEGADPSVGILVLDALLAASFVAGIETSMFALIPARFLEGRDIFEQNRVVWLTLSASAAFAFVHVLLAPNVGYGGSVVVMLALFAIFGGASVAFWAYFRYRSPRPPVLAVSDLQASPSYRGIAPKERSD